MSENNHEKSETSAVPLQCLVSCDLCPTTGRSAVKMNGISFCHDCLNFVKNLASSKNTDWWDEMDYQSKYIAKRC